MATLKSLKAHAVAVGNIQKITSSIKMVAATKFMAADKLLRMGRIFGEGAKKFYDVSLLTYIERNGLRAALTSDRGLCGSMHAKILKKVKDDQVKSPVKGLVCLGEKSKAMLLLNYRHSIHLVVNGIGHKMPTFRQASSIATRIFGDYPTVTLVYAHFKNVISYEVRQHGLMTSDWVEKTHIPFVYELGHTDALKSYLEFSSASLIFHALCETFTTEQANRITSMTTATRNAGKIKNQLMLEYNRKRQERITREIIDIVSGTNATEKKKKKKEIIQNEDDEGDQEDSKLQV